MRKIFIEVEGKNVKITSHRCEGHFEEVSVDFVVAVRALMDVVVDEYDKEAAIFSLQAIIESIRSRE